MSVGTGVEGNGGVAVGAEGGVQIIVRQWPGPEAPAPALPSGAASVPEAAAVPPEPLTFDQDLHQAISARAAGDASRGAVTAAERADVRNGLAHIVHCYVNRERAAARDAKGEGTPLGEMPFDDRDKTYIRTFLDRMAEKKIKGDIWEFDTYVKVERPAAPAVTTARRTGNGLLGGFGMRSGGTSAPAPVQLVAATERRVTRTIEGWDTGAYVFRQEGVTTPDGRELWTALQGLPERLIMGADGCFYGIPVKPNKDGRFEYQQRDILPRSVPVGMDGEAVGANFGEFLSATTDDEVTYNGRPVLYAVFQRSKTGIRERLRDIALNAGLSPKISVEADADEAVDPARDAEPSEPLA